MTDTDTVNIAGIDKGALLAALFNNSRPVGLGVLRAGEGPAVMTDEQGRALVEQVLDRKFGHDTARTFGPLDGSLYFDYLFGRPLKVNISGDDVDPWGYDRDNGGLGTFAAIVDKLRNAGGV